MLVLVTGATGEVGRGVVPFLEKDFALRLLSVDPPGDDPRRIQADILDWEALARAMNGVDAVLHLAVASGHTGTYEEDSFNDQRFDINVKGTYHVFETARRLHIGRVVHVSSVMVSWGHALLRKKSDLIPGDAPPLPVGSYALSKALGENIARYYGSHRGLGLEDFAGAGAVEVPRHRQDISEPLQVITVRIAAPLDLGDPYLKWKPVRPQQIPFPDLAKAFAQALTVGLQRYEVVTIVGDSSERMWDLGAARRVLGYQPQYYLDDLVLKFAPPFDVETR